MIHSYKKQQSGVVLVISLIMLLLMTLIGVTAMQVTGLEEKMAGNSKDKNVAFQAAEAALRDAENDIKSTRVSGLTGMTNTCASGLCYMGPAGQSKIWDEAALVANAVSYGTYTSATDIAGLSTQPHYLIVGNKTDLPGAPPGYVYTITAIATGGVSSTQSVLQSHYRP